MFCVTLPCFSFAHFLDRQTMQEFTLSPYRMLVSRRRSSVRLGPGEAECSSASRAYRAMKRFQRYLFVTFSNSQDMSFPFILVVQLALLRLFWCSIIVLNEVAAQADHRKLTIEYYNLRGNRRKRRTSGRKNVPRNALNDCMDELDGAWRPDLRHDYLSICA